MSNLRTEFSTRESPKLRDVLSILQRVATLPLATRSLSWGGSHPWEVWRVPGDQCHDAPCYQAKVTAHINREVAARPELVIIETSRRSLKEQRPGALQKHQYRELS